MTAECANPKVVLALVRVTLLVLVMILLAVGISGRQLTRTAGHSEYFAYTRVGLSDGSTVSLGDWNCGRLQASYRAALGFAVGCLVLTFALTAMALVIGVVYEKHLYKKREHFLDGYTQGLCETIERRRVVRREAERNWYRSWYANNVGNGSRREEFFARRSRMSPKDRAREDEWLLERRKQETDLIVDRTLAYPPLPFYLERADVYRKAEHDLHQKYQRQRPRKPLSAQDRVDLTDPTAALVIVSGAVGDAVARVGNIFNTIIDNRDDEADDFVYVDAADSSPNSQAAFQRNSVLRGTRGNIRQFEYNSGGGDWISDIYASIGVRHNANGTDAASFQQVDVMTTDPRRTSYLAQDAFAAMSNRPPIAGITQFLLRYATKLIYVAISLFSILCSLISWAVTADFYNNSWCGSSTPKFESFRYDSGFVCLVIAFCLHILSFVLYILESSAKRGTELLQLAVVDRVKSREYETGNGFGICGDAVVFPSKQAEAKSVVFSSSLVYFKSLPGESAPIVSTARSFNSGIRSIADFALRFGCDPPPCPT